MKKLDRTPIGISIEKLATKEYEVKLFFLPDKELDGPIIYNNSDKVYLRVFNKSKMNLTASAQRSWSK